MTIELASALRIRLVEQLEAKLKDATVYADYAISLWSIRGISEIKSLPDKGSLADQLNRYIGDRPLATFVEGELDANFSGPGINYEAKEKPLTSYHGYDNIKSVAEGLVESLVSLPWSYQVTVKLPDPLGLRVLQEFGAFELSPRHRIVSGAMLEEEFPQAHRDLGLAARMMGSKYAPPWDENSAYLQVAISGYFGAAQSEPFLAARDDVLTFYGLGLAFGLFVQVPASRLARLNESPFYVHRLTDEGWCQRATVDMPDQYEAGISTLAMHPGAAEDPAVLREKLSRISSIFRSNEGRSLALSARWLFESHCGRDALLQYIQAAVAIEVLLGDEEADPSVGLTTLMANRCAYLIAGTQAARSNLLKLFRDIYKVRSKIVHRGKSRLSSEEMNLFGALQYLLQMVIDKEQRLLERGEEKV